MWDSLWWRTVTLKLQYDIFVFPIGQHCNHYTWKRCTKKLLPLSNPVFDWGYTDGRGAVSKGGAPHTWLTWFWVYLKTADSRRADDTEAPSLHHSRTLQIIYTSRDKLSCRRLYLHPAASFLSHGAAFDFECRLHSFSPRQHLTTQRGRKTSRSAPH